MPVKKARLRARSYAVYYGYGPLAGMERFDLAILEPAGWHVHDMLELRGQGVTTLAYFSILEVSPQTRMAAGLTHADLLKVQGKPWLREEFDTVVVDPRSTTWRAYVRDRLQRLLQAGWDGLFLDSLGDIEDPMIADESGWLVPAAAELVRLAREVAGQRLVVQNNGLWLLLPIVAPYLDGIVWEGALGDVDFTEPWAQMTLESLSNHASGSGLMPMLLSEIGRDEMETKHLEKLMALGRRYGFPVYAAPFDYARGVRLPDGRIVRGR